MLFTHTYSIHYQNAPACQLIFWRNAGRFRGLAELEVLPENEVHARPLTWLKAATSTHGEHINGRGRPINSRREKGVGTFARTARNRRMRSRMSGGMGAGRGNPRDKPIGHARLFFNCRHQGLTRRKNSLPLQTGNVKLLVFSDPSIVCHSGCVRLAAL